MADAIIDIIVDLNNAYDNIFDSEDEALIVNFILFCLKR